MPILNKNHFKAWAFPPKKAVGLFVIIFFVLLRYRSTKQKRISTAIFNANKKRLSEKGKSFLFFTATEPCKLTTTN
jgi:hypothetical protein